MNSETTVEEIAGAVANLLAQRMSAKDLLRLSGAVFLDVDEAAEILRVERRTIRTWVSQESVPFRRANGRVLFLLQELLAWTVAERDRFRDIRLGPAGQHKIAAAQSAAIRERSRDGLQER